MYFSLVDKVIDQSQDTIVTLKQVTLAEEYLQDHFPGFPVLPGVMMIESLVQAGRILLEERVEHERLVLGEVRALKYGTFVRPGEALRVQVQLIKDLGEGSFQLKGEGRVIRAWDMNGANGADGPVAVNGRLTLRPVRLSVASVPG